MTRGVKRLFLGGPWHEWEVEIREDEWTFRVPMPVSLTEIEQPRAMVPVIRYVRKQMAYPNTKQVRSVFVPERWTDAEAREALVACLMIRWVRESPDANGRG